MSAKVLTLKDVDFDKDSGTITKYHSEDKDIIIPDNFDAIAVTMIGDHAFEKHYLTGVVIPDSVISIGLYAFESNKLTDLIIPSNVTTIGEDAFAYNQLTSINIPNSLTAINARTFLYNALTSVTIPNSVITIGAEAFYSNNLTSVTIPDSVTTIGAEAFASNKLTSVTIPGSVTTIKYEALHGNPLISLTIPEHLNRPGSNNFYEDTVANVIVIETEKPIEPVIALEKDLANDVDSALPPTPIVSSVTTGEEPVKNSIKENINNPSLLYILQTFFRKLFSG